MKHRWSLLALALLVGNTAHAWDLRGTIGAAGGGTSWRNDGAVYGTLRGQARFLKCVGLAGGLELGYGGADQRMLTLFKVGIQAWTPKFGVAQPYARVSFIHQHEESAAVLAGDVGSALIGVGEGIRHRAAVGFALGSEFTLWRDGKVEIFGVIEAFLNYFPDEIGPAIYGGGGLALGFNYEI